MPKYQVTRFQRIAPSSADRTTTWVTAPGSIEPLADRRGDGRAGQGAGEVQQGGQEDGRAQRQHAGAHDGRHGVGRVVEPVDVVEGQRGDDHQDEDQQGGVHGGPQAFLMTTVRRAPPTSSQASSVRSSPSRNSLCLISRMASVSVRNIAASCVR